MNSSTPVSQSDPDHSKSHAPLLAIGQFGVHLMKNPAGTFSFVGEAPVDLPGTWETYDEAYAAFLHWFRHLPQSTKRLWASNLRANVFADCINQGVFLPPSDASTPHPSGLTPDQLAALYAAKTHFGHWWKGKLKDCWMSDRFPLSLKDYQPTLQHIRNTIGAHGLNQIKL